MLWFDARLINWVQMNVEHIHCDIQVLTFKCKYFLLDYFTLAIQENIFNFHFHPTWILDSNKNNKYIIFIYIFILTSIGITETFTKYFLQWFARIIYLLNVLFRWVNKTLNSNVNYNGRFIMLINNSRMKNSIFHNCFIIIIFHIFFNNK